MYILSKDKTIFGEYDQLTVNRSYVSGKDKKYAIFGSVGFHREALSYYPTKEEAVAELEKIYAACQNGDKTYAI